MNNSQGKPCRCLHCKQVMFRKRLYDHCRSKHKDYYDSRKAEGPFRPVEEEDFTYQGVDSTALDDIDTVSTVKTGNKIICKSKKMAVKKEDLESETSGSDSNEKSVASSSQSEVEKPPVKAHTER